MDMPLELENRMSTVESALAEFIIQTNRSLHRLSAEMKDFKDEMKDFKDEMKDFKDEMKDFKDEMKDFKDEMKDFKDEMKDFKDEMKDFKDEMKDFKNEMKDFKEEMKDFKDEMRADRKQMNKQWGELANKMGTLVEDIVYPGVGPAIKQYFGDDLLEKYMHFSRHLKAKGKKGEFDVVGVSDSRVFLVETKTSPSVEKLLDFKNRIAPLFQELAGEYADKELILIQAALRFEPDLVDLATREGIYLLAYREWEFLDILNFQAIQDQNS